MSRTATSTTPFSAAGSSPVLSTRAKRTPGSSKIDRSSAGVFGAVSAAVDIVSRLFCLIRHASRAFFLEGACHEQANGIAGRHPPGKDLHDGGGDRDLDVERLRELDESAGGVDAFGDLAPERRERFLERLSGGERQPDATVPREVPGRGQDEVAHAGEAGERLWFSAEPRSEAPDLGERAGQEGRPRVLA